MTFKIVKNTSDKKPDFTGTYRAGEYIRNNLGRYGTGASAGKELLEDLYRDVLSNGDGSPTKMIDRSGSNAHDVNGEATSKLNIAKDESNRKYKMALPDGATINPDYVEGILEVLRDKFNDGFKPDDVHMKDFLLGVILLSKCR